MPGTARPSQLVQGWGPSGLGVLRLGLGKQGHQKTDRNPWGTGSSECICDCDPAVPLRGKQAEGRLTRSQPHNPDEAGWRLEPQACRTGQGQGCPPAGPCRAQLSCLYLLPRTWSRYRGSTSARTLSALLLISDGFSATQFPGGRGRAGRELPFSPHGCRAGASLTLLAGENPAQRGSLGPTAPQRMQGGPGGDQFS